MKQKETVLDVVKELRDLFNQLVNILPGVIAAIKPVCSKDGRSVRNADSTVTDKQLNLLWYPTLPKKFTWAEAKAECEKIGCRLPTRQELISLQDITKYDPAIDKEIFPDTKTDDYYWTSDSCAWDSGGAWCVAFSFGYVDSSLKGSHGCVRPVRSSQ
jgi:hypothetical protein